MDGTSPVYSAAEALRTGGRDAARAALLAARERTLALAQAWVDALGNAELRVPYRETLNPPLWEWGHVAWFQEWWVIRNRQRERGVGCDPDHVRRPSRMLSADERFDSSRVPHARRWDIALPSWDETRSWLASTLDASLAALDALPPQPSHDELYFFRLVALHEEMHAEAAVYMAHALGIPVPASVLREPAPLHRPHDVLRVPAQRFVLGSPGEGFAFDNELAAHALELAAFEIDAEPVSASRFLEFVEAGGYGERRWWDDAGWAWQGTASRDARERAAVEGAGAATHLTAYEAQAWCRWAGRRPPTEAEWECAALTQPGFAWGHAWEWTASRFEPYPGFVAHPYRDYSAPWFGSRRVLRGAGPATAATLAHPRYRNFFPPGRSDIFAGFRSCA